MPDAPTAPPATPPGTMRAAYYSRYGPAARVLSVRTVTTPRPEPGQVLIRVRTSTVTTGDVRIRGWDIPSAIFWLPARLAMGIFGPRRRIPGFEISGTIEQVVPRPSTEADDGTADWSPGDEVIASTGLRFGANAEYLCLPADGMIVRRPEATPADAAAAVPFAGLTALYFLRDLGGFQPGQRVLVNGASGAIGTYAVQMIRHWGGEAVGVCSGRNAELVLSLGASAVIDYTQTDPADPAAHEGPYDLILDTVGKLSFARTRHLLTERGAFLAVVMDLRTVWQTLTTRWSSKRRVKGGVTPDRPADLRLLADLLEQGAIRPVIDRTYRLDEIVAAHEYVETGHKRGGVLIECGPA